jgi:DNA polymerase elongation subunit (family B)
MHLTEVKTMANLIIDIETISIESERLEDYKKHFEPVEPVVDEEEPEINPKTGKPKRKAKAKSSSGKVRSKKSEKPGLHWLTGRVIVACVKPEGKEPVAFSDDDEEKLLVALHEYLMARYPYTIITYNGKSFDVPFLVMRGALYGLDFASVLPSDRYSKSHFDVYENTAGGKWGLPAKLSELAWFLGLPDVEGAGSQVQEQYNAGDIEGIIEHCKSDVTTTESIYKMLFGRKQRKL